MFSKSFCLAELLSFPELRIETAFDTGTALLAALTSEVERLQRQLRQLDENGQATQHHGMQAGLCLSMLPQLQ